MVQPGCHFSCRPSGCEINELGRYPPDEVSTGVYCRALRDTPAYTDPKVIGRNHASKSVNGSCECGEAGGVFGAGSGGKQIPSQPKRSGPEQPRRMQHPGASTEDGQSGQGAGQSEGSNE